MKRINLKKEVVLSMAIAGMSLIPNYAFAMDNSPVDNSMVYNIINNELASNESLIVGDSSLESSSLTASELNIVPITAGAESAPDTEDISSMLTTFSDLDIKVLVTQDTRLVKDYEDDLNDEDNHFSYVKKGNILTVVGENDKFYKVSINNYFVYILKDKVTTNLEAIKKEESKPAMADEKPIVVANTWNGPKLNKRKGVNQGPSGRETYYNLPMGGVIKTMRRKGNTDKYWVRADGCKMLGDYIMVAANLKVRPHGSIVETSLGKGIVCDTGGFAKRNIYQLDIATNW